MEIEIIENEVFVEVINMIEIIKEKPEKYIMICTHCDCKFSYDLKDLKTDYYCQAKVLCPCCGTDLLHTKREREN